MLGDPREFDRRAVGESRNEREAPTHRLHRPSQCGEQQVASLFESGDAVELTRFRGYRTLLGGGIHDATNTPAVPA